MAHPANVAAPLTPVLLIALTSDATLAVFGIDTGLNPGHMAAGLAGGWIALSFLTGLTWWRCVMVEIVSAQAAGLSAKLAGAIVYAWATSEVPWWPKAASADALAWPLAMGIGLLTYGGIAPLLIAAAKRAQRMLEPAP